MSQAPAASRGRASARPRAGRGPHAPSATEWLTFALIKDAARLPGGKYVGMESAAVGPWPHQRIVARRLIDGWPYSFLLCDEVGLGKTIECGLAMRSLYMAGYLRRVLIAAPAHLTGQWQREMAQKFFLPFARALPGTGVQHAWLLPSPQITAGQSLYEHPLTVVSTGLLARAGRREDLERAGGFELTILDEAQCARRANPTQGTAGHPHYNQLYSIVEKLVRPKSRGLWLATATPMQLHEVEAADLARLTRRAGAFLDDPSLTFGYYEVLSKLRSRGDLEPAEWAFVRRALRAVEQQDPDQWRYIKATVIGRGRQSEVHTWLDRPLRSLSPQTLEAVRRLLFAAAPLARTMLRHTRALLGEYGVRGELNGRLPRRMLLPIPQIHFTGQERSAYERLERYCGQLTRRLSATGAMRNAIGFFLNFLQLRFASSLYAIRCTLERRHDKVERALRLRGYAADEGGDGDLEQALFEIDEGDEEAASAFLRYRTPADLAWERLELRSMLQDLQDLSATPSKFAVLLEYLEGRRRSEDGRIRQMVLFTRFFDTLTDVAQRLVEHDRGLRLGCYSGPACRFWSEDRRAWTETSRDEVNRRFLRGDIDVLLCTDAAAEGLNLQTADLVVNYDLPWNPMKVEQRIGRIDRIGQRHDEIQVLNLCYPDSVEQFVYGRLLARLEGIMQTIGRQNISLLPVTARELQELAQRRLGPEALEARVRERLKDLERRNQAFEIPAHEQYDMYTRLAQSQPAEALPVTVEAAFDALAKSACLESLGCHMLALPEGKVLVVGDLPGVAAGTALTASRELYERGSAQLNAELRFATWGEPAFEAAVAAVLAHDPPRCVRRLEVPVPASGATLVAYAVATPRGIALVKSLGELAGLELAECEAVSEEQTARLTAQLKIVARREGRACVQAERVEAANESAGRTEAALHAFAAAHLLEVTADEERALFRPALAALQRQLADHQAVRVGHLPVGLVRAQRQLLFDVVASPGDAANFHVDLPRFMFDVLYDCARRAAEALRVGRERLTVGQVVERLKREADRALAAGGATGPTAARAANGRP